MNYNKYNDLWPFLESLYQSKLPIKGCDLKIKNDNGEEVFILFYRHFHLI